MQPLFEKGDMEISRIMFALLRSALFDTELDGEVKNQITTETLPKLYRMSKVHDLTHLVALGLEKNDLLDLDSIATERYFEIRGLSVFRFEQMRYELERIYELFEQSGVAYIPLKGSVIRQYYPEPWMRTSCDIDILVREECLEKAVCLLTENLGYTKSGKNFHDVSLTSPSGVHLELHFCILENQANIDGLLAKAWDYGIPENQMGRYALTAEFLLFHVLAHASYHFLSGGCGVRPILDYYILKQRVAFDERTLFEMLQNSRLTKFYEAVCALANAWFADEPLPTKYEDVQAYILCGGVYGNLENKVTVQQTKKGGKGKYVWGRIFMPYAELKVAYPVLEKRKWLTPFYQVKRWFCVIFGGRLKKSVRELNASVTVSEASAIRAKQMMKELELL